jgi:hypothetical protein
MSDDPRRLSELGSEAPEQIRSLFRAGRNDLPNAQELGRVETRLATLLGGAVVAGLGAETAAGAGVAKAGAAAGGSMVAKGAAIAAIAVIAGGGLFMASRSASEQSAPVEAPSETAVTAPAPPERRAPAIVPILPAPVTTSASPAPPAHAEPAPPRGPSEVELLRQAQSALSKDPKRALALTQEHKRRFPDGALVQEREVIAVDALGRLGDREQAKKRADEFDRRYPDSAHRRKVEAAAER